MLPVSRHSGPDKRTLNVNLRLSLTSQIDISFTLVWEMRLAGLASARCAALLVLDFHQNTLNWIDRLIEMSNGRPNHRIASLQFDHLLRPIRKRIAHTPALQYDHDCLRMRMHCGFIARRRGVTQHPNLVILGHHLDEWQPLLHHVLRECSCYAPDQEPAANPEDLLARQFHSRSSPRID